ncbi:MAG: hypothetical protein VW446_03510 [Alphaproteobacteria bacterium]
MEERHLTDFLFTSESELKSYSDSFESRARDRFVAFVKELFELGSSDEYRTMFHSDKIVINKRNRRLLDYIEVSALIDRVEIISLNQEVTQRLLEIIKTEKGFETVHHDQVNSRVTIPLPPLTMNQMLELADAIVAKEKQIERNLFSVKAQTGQQIRKGIENEYIDNIDAAKVSKEIDQIVEHYLHVGKLFSIAKREMVMGSFKPKTPEDAELYEQIGPARDVLLGKTMEQPTADPEPEDMTMVE